MSAEPTMEPLLEDESATSASGSHFSQLRRNTTMPVRRTSIGNQSSTSHGGLRRSRSRQFSRSSTDISPLDPISEDSTDNQHDDATHWHAFALVFVALPAIAGLFFENGGAIMTDILLLALGCLFLYWSVKWPWQWYHSSQGRIFIDFDPAYLEDEDIALETPITDAEAQGLAEGADATGTTIRDPKASSSQQRQQALANESLQRHELMALAACFLMPVGVAYLLHAIRPYLSRPSGGLVSNSNLTLFVLAAEVRPFLHVFRMINKRTMHLQKIVAAPPQQENATVNSEEVSNELSELTSRINHVELTIAELNTLPPQPKDVSSSDTDKREKSTAETEAMITSATQSLQPQLDALNRAMRRYEKRAAMQAVILDARLRELDNRVSDTLSLAAAASRMSQRPGLVSWAWDSTSGVVSRSVQSVLALPLLPYRVAQQAYGYLLGGKQKRRRGKKELEKGKKLVIDLDKGKRSSVEVR